MSELTALATAILQQAGPEWLLIGAMGWWLNRQSKTLTELTVKNIQTKIAVVQALRDLRIAIQSVGQQQ